MQVVFIFEGKEYKARPGLYTLSRYGKAIGINSINDTFRTLVPENGNDIQWGNLENYSILVMEGIKVNGGECPELPTIFDGILLNQKSLEVFITELTDCYTKEEEKKSKVKPKTKVT